MVVTKVLHRISQRLPAYDGREVAVRFPVTADVSITGKEAVNS